MLVKIDIFVVGHLSNCGNKKLFFSWLRSFVNSIRCVPRNKNISSAEEEPCLWVSPTAPRDLAHEHIKTTFFNEMAQNFSPNPALKETERKKNKQKRDINLRCDHVKHQSLVGSRKSPGSTKNHLHPAAMHIAHQQQKASSIGMSKRIKQIGSSYVTRHDVLVVALSAHVCSFGR